MRMSNLDILSRDFWKDNRRFADLFNTVLYDGKQVILPEKLMEADSNLSGSIQTKKKEDVFVERRQILSESLQGTVNMPSSCWKTKATSIMGCLCG